MFAILDNAKATININTRVLIFVDFPSLYTTVSRGGKMFLSAVGTFRPDVTHSSLSFANYKVIVE